MALKRQHSVIELLDDSPSLAIPPPTTTTDVNNNDGSSSRSSRKRRRAAQPTPDHCITIDDGDEEDDVILADTAPTQSYGHTTTNTTVAISSSSSSRSRRARRKQPILCNLLDDDKNALAATSSSSSPTASATATLNTTITATTSDPNRSNDDIILLDDDDDESTKQSSDEHAATNRLNDINDIHDIHDDIQITTPAPTYPTPMERIFLVFPDIDRKHVESLFTKHGVDLQMAQIPLDPAMNTTIDTQVQTIISSICESSYPKQKMAAEEPIKAKMSIPPALTSSSAHYTSTGRRSNKVQKMKGPPQPEDLPERLSYQHDYSSPSAEYDLSKAYEKECIAYLMHVFPFMSMAGLLHYLKACKGRYAICYQRICDALIGKGDTSKTVAVTTGAATASNNGIDEERQEEEYFYGLENALNGGRLTPSQHESLRLPTQQPSERNTLTKPRRPKRITDAQTNTTSIITPTVTDDVLIEEINFAHYKLVEWKQTVRMKIWRRQVREESEMNGTTLECQCCYADCAFEELVACREEGHLFCVDCLRRNVEARVFGFGDLGGKKGDNASFELTCMHVDGCNSGFSMDLLKKALPRKVMEKYDEIQASLSLAGVAENLCKCPKCGFQAMLADTEMVFKCPIQTCKYESCRKCGEASHIPLRCEEVEKKGETNARLLVEEAMTKARVRTCPKATCKRQFYKSDGCNKMTCPACGTFSCYICRKDISKEMYKHFCQKAHCKHTNCHQCPLYTKSEEDDLRAARDAGLKTVEELKMKAIDSNKDDETLKINVDSLLKTPGRL